MAYFYALVFRRDHNLNWVRIGGKFLTMLDYGAERELVDFGQFWTTAAQSTLHKPQNTSKYKTRRKQNPEFKTDSRKIRDLKKMVDKKFCEILIF